MTETVLPLWIEFRSNRKTGRNHKMMIFILPCILIPLRANELALVISYKSKISNWESLSQIL